MVILRTWANPGHAGKRYMAMPIDKDPFDHLLGKRIE